MHRLISPGSMEEAALFSKLFCYHVAIWCCEQAKTNTEGELINFGAFISKKKPSRMQHRAVCVDLKL